MSPGSSPLTAFQVEVATVFFELPEAAGFLLAGGAALAAQGLTDRPTQDLDLFTAPGRGDVPAAEQALVAAAEERGWTVRVVRSTPTFSRLVVNDEQASVPVDLAVDSAPELPAIVSVAGPTLALEELAGRKVLALFDRAEARDFADVHMLAARYGRDRLIDLAATADAGFDRAIFADMLDSVERFTDDEVPAVDVVAVREFAAGWAAELRAEQA